MNPGKSPLRIAAMVLLAIAGGWASAQSTDPSNPTPATSRVINGKGNGATVDYYYQVTAGPGTLAVSFKAATFSYAETVTAEVFDGPNKLLRLDLSADSDGPQNSGSVALPAQRTLLIHVLSKPRIATYQLRLAGPLQFAPSKPAAIPAYMKQPGLTAHGPRAMMNPNQALNAAKLPPSPCAQSLSSSSLALSALGEVVALGNCGFVVLEMQDGSIQQIPIAKIKKLAIKR